MVRGVLERLGSARWAGAAWLMIALAVLAGHRAGAQVVVTQPQIAEPLAQPDEPTEATGLFGPIPTGGVIEELTQDLGLGVWTAQLANGVLVHVRAMDARPDWVEISIVLSGGVLDESSATRGLTNAAVQVFERPATRTLDSQAVASRLAGRVLEVAGRARLEVVTLRLSGDRMEMVAAMQLAHALLTAPRLEASALGQWQAVESKRMRSYQHRVSAQLNRAALDALYPPGELRIRPLSAERIESIALDEAQAWLDRFVASAPIEVGIVGDISTAEALELARVYLGTIGSRERIGRVIRSDRETVPLEPMPAVETVCVPGDEPEGFVLVGYLVPVEFMRERERVLRVATRIISQRLDAEHDDDARLEGSSRLLPRLGLLDQGLFYVVLRAKPDGIDAVRKAARGLLADLAGHEADLEEIQRARSSIIDEVVKLNDDPAWWVRRLGWWRIDREPVEPADEIIRAYEAITAQQVRDTVRRVLHPERLLDIAVLTTPIESEQE